MTDRQKQRLKSRVLEELANSPIVESACRKVGLPRATYYRWLSEDAGFEDEAHIAIAQGRERVNDVAESVVIKGIKEENPKYVFFWLQHNHRRYVKRRKVKRPFLRLFPKSWDSGDSDWPD